MYSRTGEQRMHAFSHGEPPIPRLMGYTDAWKLSLDASSTTLFVMEIDRQQHVRLAILPAITYFAATHQRGYGLTSVIVNALHHMYHRRDCDAVKVIADTGDAATGITAGEVVSTAVTTIDFVRSRRIMMSSSWRCPKE